MWHKCGMNLFKYNKIEFLTFCYKPVPYVTRYSINQQHLSTKNLHCDVLIPQFFV